MRLTISLRDWHGSIIMMSYHYYRNIVPTMLDRLFEFNFSIPTYPNQFLIYVTLFLNLSWPVPYVLFGISVLFDGLSTYIKKKEPFLNSAFVGLCWIYPNHLKWVSLDLSFILQNILKTAYFLIISFLILPDIHLNILISTCLFCA